MMILLNIKDSKVDFFMELLKNLPFVKAKPLSPEKSKVLEELQEAVGNMKLINEGKIEARPAKDILNEL